MRGFKKLMMAIAITGCTSVPAHADDCFLPEPPSKTIDFKNTNDSEVAQMGTTLRQVNEELKTYLKCLDFAHKTGMTDQDYRSKLDTYNKRVDDLTRVAAEYNKGVKTFKPVKG